MHSNLLFLSLKCLESAKTKCSLCPTAAGACKTQDYPSETKQVSSHLKKRFLKSVLSWLQLRYTPDRYLSSALTKPMSFPPLLTNKSSHNLVGTHRTDHTADLRVLLRLQVNSLALVVPAKRRKKKRKCMNPL